MATTVQFPGSKCILVVRVQMNCVVIYACRCRTGRRNIQWFTAMHLPNPNLCDQEPFKNMEKVVQVREAGGWELGGCPQQGPVMND